MDAPGGPGIAEPERQAVRSIVAEGGELGSCGEGSDAGEDVLADQADGFNGGWATENVELRNIVITMGNRKTCRYWRNPQGPPGEPLQRP